MTKKKFKIVLILIIGIIIGSCISVYATYNYFASDVRYKRTDGTEISVEQALNELYRKSNNTWQALLNLGFSYDEIVNSENLFNKVIEKEPDIEYMINSVDTIMPSVINSGIAMKIIGNNVKLSNLIFGNTNDSINTNERWISAILKNSNAINALDQTNPITVPNMTNYTSPSGIASESSCQSGHPCWQAFNTNSTKYYSDWASGSFSGVENPAYIQYKFPNPVLVYKFYMQNRNTDDKWVESPSVFSLLASNDGNNWDNLGNYTNTNYKQLASNTYIVQNIKKKYSYYRISITEAKLSDGSNSSWASIQRLQFYAK